MAALSQAACRNRLLALMPPADFALLAPDLLQVELPRELVLVEADAPIEYVCFPETGLGSIVARSPEGQEIEAGIFGHDGVAPLPALMGVGHSVHRTIMQVSGHGYRLGIPSLTAAMDRSPSLRSILLRFMQVMSTQTSFTALSNSLHQIDERLARWLLMCHDRHTSDEMPLKHEFLSLMLGVRRPSVTTSLHVLEGNGFIRNERGWITIRNRRALEEFAGDAYGKPEAEYERLIGPMRPS